MSRPSSRTAAGFTLIELVVVIVVAAIVAAFIVLFLDAPVQSYFAQTRRSDLVDSADRITAAVTADVRTALPNSLRVRAVGTRSALELLATTGVARYYGQGEQHGVAGEELTIGSQVQTFGTLDSFGTQALPYQVAAYLSIGNPGTASYDAYNPATGVMTPAALQVTVGPNPSASPPPPFVAGEDLVTLSAKSTFQAPVSPPPVHNAYLVSGPVSYVCDSGAGTLSRYSGYAVRAAQSVSPGGASALIAHDVTQCAMSIVSAPASYAYGELAIITVTLASGGETLQVFLEAPAEYTQ